MAFADFAGGDYRLTDTSKYRAMGSDGKALGADTSAIDASRGKGRP